MLIREGEGGQMSVSRRKKKKWTQPLFIVLVKGKPEEKVLTGCKSAGGVEVAPDTADTGCLNWEPECSVCSSVAGS